MSKPTSEVEWIDQPPYSEADELRKELTASRERERELEEKLKNYHNGCSAGQCHEWGSKYCNAKCHHRIQALTPVKEER